MKTYILRHTGRKMSAIYERINNAVSCDDLLEYGKKILLFSSAALKLESNKRRRALDLFYERLAMCSPVGSLIGDNTEKYKIYEGKDATRCYMLYSRPAYSTPMKTLRSFISYGRYLANNIVPPQGEVISPESVAAIIDFIDHEYDFFDRVFTVRKPIIAIMDYSKKDFNSETAFFLTPEGMITHFFLYHMKKDAEPQVSPEAVFFHELGHALHYKYMRGDIYHSGVLLQKIKRYMLPTVEFCAPEEQPEIIADILSVAMMHGSPFEKYNPFTQMRIDDIYGFQSILREMLDGLVIEGGVGL